MAISPKPPHIHLIGQPFGCLGIANHTRSLFKAIINAVGQENASVYPIFPLESMQVDPLVDPSYYTLEEPIKSCLRRGLPSEKISGIVFIFWTPDIYKRIAALVDRSNSTIVGYFIFEWTKISSEHIEAIQSSLNLICVTSDFQKNIISEYIEDGSAIRKGIIEAGVDDAFKQLYDVERSKDFLYVGKYEARKCTKELFEMFASEPGLKNVKLTAACWDPSNPMFDPRELPFIKNGANNNITFVRPKSQEEMAELYSEHRFLVMPSRSGGVELPLLEAQSRGCIPIVTSYSAMQHYIDSNSYSINVHNLVPMYDEKWFPPYIDWGNWAEPDMTHLLNTIRYLSSSKDMETQQDFLKRSKEVRMWSTNFAYPTIVKKFLSKVLTLHHVLRREEPVEYTVDGEILKEPPRILPSTLRPSPFRNIGRGDRARVQIRDEDDLRWQTPVININWDTVVQTIDLARDVRVEGETRD